jgi:hypothetical protein
VWTGPTCHLSAKLEARDSAKGGRGVFARTPIGGGEVLVVWGGEVITSEQLLAAPPAWRRLVLQVEEGLYLATSREGPGDWVNHSCAPNGGLAGQITLVALRTIAPGEEICFDYAMSEGSAYDEFACRCGAVGCRGRVTADDWRLPALQARYRGHFSPYLERRIQAAARAVHASRAV